MSAGRSPWFGRTSPNRSVVRQEIAEQIGAVRQEIAEQIGAVRQEVAEQIECGASGGRRTDGAVRQEIAAVRQELAVETGRLRTEIAESRAELMRAINRQTFWMNGFLAALLVAVIGLGGVLITRLGRVLTAGMADPLSSP